MDIQKNDITLIRVEKRSYKGKDFVDLRQFFKDDNGEFKPTQKGVTLPPDLLTELIEALEKLNNEVVIIDEETTN